MPFAPLEQKALCVFIAIAFSKTRFLFYFILSKPKKRKTMIATTESLDDFNSLLLPFKYDGALIYSKLFKGAKGFYGIKGNVIAFTHKEDLEESFEIEVPENMEELNTFMETIDFIMHKIAMSGYVSCQGNESLENPEDILRPFMDFVDHHERGINIMGGIKNGVI